MSRDASDLQAGTQLRLIHGLTRPELADAFSRLGEPSYRADQLWQWLYCRAVDNWDAMTNLPSSLRARLAGIFSLQAVVPLKIGAAKESGRETRKILLGLRDGECVEQVLIPAGRPGEDARESESGSPSGARPRLTICISTQAGCRFLCAFCASGQTGLKRNLEAAEIVAQVVLAARLAGERPSHVVFMGVGEPLDNYDEVLRSVRILNDPDGLGIGARRMTISTCGIIPGILRLADEGLQLELSVSLHAATSELRDQLMPVNRRYPLRDLIDACRTYTDRTSRIITFEYTLVRGVNDGLSHADDLVGLLHALKCRVNLLFLSPVEGFDHQPPTRATADIFIDRLRGAGINATLREPRGCALHAACGQLRHSHRRDTAQSPNGAPS